MVNKHLSRRLQQAARRTGNRALRRDRMQGQPSRLPPPCRARRLRPTPCGNANTPAASRCQLKPASARRSSTAATARSDIHCANFFLLVRQPDRIDRPPRSEIADYVEIFSKGAPSGGIGDSLIFSGDASCTVAAMLRAHSKRARRSPDRGDHYTLPSRRGNRQSRRRTRRGNANAAGVRASIHARRTQRIACLRDDRRPGKCLPGRRRSSQVHDCEKIRSRAAGSRPSPQTAAAEPAVSPPIARMELPLSSSKFDISMHIGQLLRRRAWSNRISSAGIFVSHSINVGMRRSAGALGRRVPRRVALPVSRGR